MRTEVSLSEGGLHLRPFEPSDIQNFSDLHADPDVMKDLGGPIGQGEARDKLDGYIAAFDQNGYGRLAVFEFDVFVGYVGVLRHEDDAHPLGPHDEIGWRIHQRFWGKGLASRATKLALKDVFDRVKLPKVLSYTAPDNLRSQAVMARLGFSRNAALDFVEDYPPVGQWHGYVWQITAADWAAHQRSGGIE